MIEVFRLRVMSSKEIVENMGERRLSPSPHETADESGIRNIGKEDVGKRLAVFSSFQCADRILPLFL